LRDYIRRFSKQCTELPSVADPEIISAFLQGTTCRDLVNELGRGPPSSANELFDVATNFASGEEAVGAIFDSKTTKRKEDAPAEGSKTKTPTKKQKRGNKGKKKGPQNHHGQGQEEDSDKAFAITPDRKGPRGPPRGGGLFDNMLKKPYSYHKGSINHTLEQCDMLRKYFNRLGPKDKDKKKDAGDKGGDGDPSVDNVFFTFGGPTANMTSRQRKRERREVFSVRKATPSYLD